MVKKFYLLNPKTFEVEKVVTSAELLKMMGFKTLTCLSYRDSVDGLLITEE